MQTQSGFVIDHSIRIPYQVTRSKHQDSNFDLLESAIINLIESNDPRAIQKLDIRLVKSNFNPSDLKFLLFSSALLSLTSKGSQSYQNLYLTEFGTKQINLFDLMSKKLPFLTMSESIANECISQHLQNEDDVTLIDIGIGTGRQLTPLIHMLGKVRYRPKRLKIVGIEPAREALLEAEKKIKAAAESFGIQLEFVPIQNTIEKLTSSQWKEIKALGGSFLANDSFALHHVQSDMKDRVIRCLKDLDPVSFILTEPHSDHETSGLLNRFHNAWKHFGLVFDTIDQLELTQEECLAMKCFFYREIEDILANHEDARSERHETAEMWISRLCRHGFRLDSRFVQESREDALHGVKLARKNGYLGLDFQNETVVALISVS